MICLNCSTSLTNKRSKYCSNKCQLSYQRDLYIQRWLRGEETGLQLGERVSEGVRYYLTQKYGNKCSKCGWSEVHPITNKVPLQVDHIDGNCLNNKEENLRLLCPNCHSLTPTYGALNIGKGRTRRRENRKLGL